MVPSISLTVDGFHFDFHNVVEAYVFDEKEILSPHFHGGFMKAVDIVAEFSDRIFFIELKDYRDQEEQFTAQFCKSGERTQGKNDALKWLKDYLKYKFRDTFLYRYAENGIPTKDIHYICLLSLSSGTRQLIKKLLPAELPVGRKGKRWTRILAKSCQIVDVEGWNRTLSEYATVRFV